MKHILLAILLSSVFVAETLKAAPSEDEASSSSYNSTPRKVSLAENSEEIEELDIEEGVYEKKDKKPEGGKRRESLEEFQDKYFQKMGKLFFILQRLSRFGNYGCLTLIGGISAYATWLDQQTNQNSSDCNSSTSTTTTATALNLSVLFLTIASAGALGMDMYATNFLKEAKKKQGDN